MAAKTSSRGTGAGKAGTARKKTDKSTVVLRTSENIGEVFIADDVVANIAALAAQEVEGVSSVAPSATGEMMNKVGLRNTSPSSKGVKAEILGGVVRIGIALVVKYGYPVPSIGQQVQAKVQNAVENMTGLKVNDVNVRVIGVDVN